MKQLPSFPTRFLLVMPTAFLIALMYDIPHILLIAFLLVLMPSFREKAWETTKPLIFCGLPVSLVLAFLPNYIFEVNPARLTRSDAALRSYLFIPMFLYGIAFMCNVKRSRERSAFIVMLSSFAMLLSSGGGFPEDQPSVRFPFAELLLNGFNTLYAVCAVLQFCGVMLLITADARAAGTNATAWKRFLILLFVPLLLWGEYAFYSAHEKEAKRWEQYLIGKIRKRHSRKIREKNDGLTRIRHSYLRKDGRMPEAQLLFRIFAEQSPGYLRGKVYDTYNPGGIWQNSAIREENSPLPDWAKDKELAFSYYPFPRSGDGLKKIMEIFPVSGFEYFPVPGNTGAVEMVSDDAKLTQDGVLTASGVRLSAGYITYAEAPDSFAAASHPPNGMQRRYRMIPGHLYEFLNRQVLAVFGNKKAMSVEITAETVIRHLLANYEYSLAPGDIRRIPGEGAAPDDPVERFLSYSGAGHCELFASSAVLLLRAAGIPARYVTGFVCGDFHPAGFYYATTRNAHAWIEYFDPQKGKWIAADPTPPVWLEDLQNPAVSSFDVRMEKMKIRFQRLLAGLFRGHPSKWLNRIAVRILEDSRTVPVILLLVLSGAGVILVIRYRRNPLRHYPPSLRRLCRSMQKWERTCKIRRKQEESWQEWAMQFPDPEIRKLVEQYEILRYRQTPPSMDSVKDFEKRLKNRKEGI